MRNSIFVSDNLKSLSTVIFVVVLLLSFWFYSGTRPEEDTILKVEITENAEIILDGQRTALRDFQLAVNNLMAEYERQGIGREQVVVAIHADKKLNLGVIFDVQQQLKDSGLNRLSYAN